MAMGQRKPRQESLFVPTHELAQPGHPFYHKLNALLDEAGFDRWVEEQCRQYYEHEEKRGRKSVPPGVADAVALRVRRLNIETGICQDIEKPNLVRLIIDR